MSERAVPYFCPFCGEESFLRPHGETHGQWECRACRRVFALKMLGLLGNQGAVGNGDLGSPDVQGGAAAVTADRGRDSE